MICELDEQKREVRLFPAVWISGLNQFLVFTGFEKCSYQDHLSFCIGQMNIACLLETKHFISQWWIISQWDIPVNPVGFFCNLLEPLFTPSCCSPHFSMSRLPSPCMWMKVQVMCLIFLIIFQNWAVLKAGDALPPAICQCPCLTTLGCLRAQFKSK